MTTAWSLQSNRMLVHVSCLQFIVHLHVIGIIINTCTCVHCIYKVHDVIRDVERKKEERHRGNGKMKMRVASGGMYMYNR